MQKVVAENPFLDYSLGMEIQLAQIVESGTTKQGFVYTIKVHLQGNKNQYFALRGNKGERFSFFHSSKSLSYLRNLLADK